MALRNLGSHDVACVDGFGSFPLHDDYLYCPTCGWKGSPSELLLVGIEYSDVDDLMSVEFQECPECRADAGHMHVGRHTPEETIEKVEIAENDMTSPASKLRMVSDSIEASRGVLETTADDDHHLFRQLEAA